jgi:Methyltransferase FkbM domain
MLQADTTGLFSSTEDPKIGEIDQHFKASGLEPPTWTNVQVPAVTLQELLDECPPVDLLALDIEGAEIDALKGLGDHRPRVLLVEAGEEERKANDAFLETIGMNAPARCCGTTSTATRGQTWSGCGRSPRSPGCSGHHLRPGRSCRGSATQASDSGSSGEPVLPDSHPRSGSCSSC